MHLIWLDDDSIVEIPGVLLSNVRGIAGMVSVEADGIAEHCCVQHPDDDPVAALNIVIERGTEFVKLLEDSLADAQAKVKAARALLESNVLKEVLAARGSVLVERQAPALPPAEDEQAVEAFNADHD